MWKKPNLSLLNFFLGFFSPSNLDFFFWKKKPNFQIWFFLFQKKKPNLNLVFFSYEFGFFLKKTVSDTYLKCFLQKKSKFIREKDQIQIWFFFWNKKKTNLEIWFFFQKKKIQRGCSTCLQVVYPWKYSTFPIMNFFKTWHVHFVYLYGLPQRVLKVWDNFDFPDFMGSPLWVFWKWVIHKLQLKIQRGDPMKS